MAKEKPGVMVYWETFDVLESLVDGDAKLMISAIRQYSQYGALPDFSGNAILSTLWLLIRPKLDADSERYERIREQKREAGRASAAKRAGKSQQALTDVDECQRIQPTTTATTTSTAPAEAETSPLPTAPPEEGIRDHEEMDKGRTLTSPPQSPHSDSSDFDFEDQRRLRIEAFNAAFDRR